jgi:hypothetical protein
MIRVPRILGISGVVSWPGMARHSDLATGKGAVHGRRDDVLAAAASKA